MKHLLGVRLVLLLSLVSFAKGQQTQLPDTDKTLPLTDASKDCIVEYKGKFKIKRLNDTWQDPYDPCKIHKCELDSDGLPTSSQFREYCYLTCSNEYEMQSIPGQCCGQCVKTKCKFNNQLHGVGETWKSPDNCVMFECIRKEEGASTVNYTKKCPPLPRMCKQENILIKDCCEYCNKSPVQKKLFKINEEEPAYPDSYEMHPCKRSCMRNETPRVCKYTFTVEWYETMSKACFDCPNNATHCSLPHCIGGDGTEKSIMVVNRMMPGPSIEVCFGDTIIVDVINHLMGDTTTIHWHGLHQRGTQYMDGVPLISQCGITPEQTFRYEFRADNTGTHFWHSHTGMQRGDGTFGPLIIREPLELDQHRGLYDFDKSDHKIIVQDYASVTGMSMFNAHHHAKGRNKPRNILINGKGRIVQRAEEKTEMSDLATRAPPAEPPRNPYPPTLTMVRAEKIENQAEAVPTNLKETPADLKADIQVNPEDTDTITFDVADSELFTYAPSEKIEESTDQTQTPEETPEESTSDKVDVALIRKKREIPVTSEKMPLHVFHVQKGKRYRFRLINAEFLNCPMELSIDNHTMVVISSDGYEFEALEVDAFVSYAGERFDFVLNANKRVNNYWIRVKGLMDCDERFTSAHQAAVLRYNGAPDIDPIDFPNYNFNRGGIVLNALNRGQEDKETVSIANVKSIVKEDSAEKRLKEPTVDLKYYIYYDFYGKNHTSFHKPNLYGFNQVAGDEQRFSPQLNHISMRLPPFPLLPARHMINEHTFCNASTEVMKGRNCQKEFCQCPHVIQIPLNASVELVLIDEGLTYDANHPFHLHGNAFRVAGMERLDSNISFQMVQDLDKAGKLKRNLENMPKKDTVTIPDGGYTIVRFIADNPGYWLFHCHIEFHAEIGMALVFKVGSHDDMPPVPQNFPTCLDFTPSERQSSKANSYHTVAIALVLISVLISAAISATPYLM